jgi:hypothetical protein
VRFSLGSLGQDETRASAQRFGLAVADKKDSQDICFVQQASYARLVEGLRPEAAEPGEIVDCGGGAALCDASLPLTTTPTGGPFLPHVVAAGEFGKCGVAPSVRRRPASAFGRRPIATAGPCAVRAAGLGCGPRRRGRG